MAFPRPFPRRSLHPRSTRSGARAPMPASSSCAHSTAPGMRSVRGMIRAGSGGRTLHGWRLQATSTAGARTRKRSSRRAFRATTWGATFLGKAFAWTPRCATHFSSCFKNAMGTATAISSATPSRATGSRTREPLSGSTGSLPARVIRGGTALNRTAAKTDPGTHATHFRCHHRTSWFPPPHALSFQHTTHTSRTLLVSRAFPSHRYVPGHLFLFCRMLSNCRLLIISRASRWCSDMSFLLFSPPRLLPL